MGPLLNSNIGPLGAARALSAEPNPSPDVPDICSLCSLRSSSSLRKLAFPRISSDKDLSDNNSLRINLASARLPNFS